MKTYSKLFIFIFALFALCGCEQKAINQGGDDKEDVIFPSGDYIFFNVENPTRAALKKGYLQENFMVLGYKYIKVQSNDGWKTKKIMASQTATTDEFFDYQNQKYEACMGVFGLSDRYNEEITPDNTPDAQLVEYIDGVHQYDPLQEWEPNLTYSFFAWYPANLDVNKKDDTDYRDVEGNPYITYNLDVTDRTKMYDVMTACKIDAKKRDGISVGLTMEHRLSALDIQAVNVISPKDIKGLWEEDIKTSIDGFSKTNNGDLTDLATLISGIDETDEVFVNITSLSMTLDNLYTKAQISLNTDEETCDYKKDTSGDDIVINGQRVKNTIIPSVPTDNITFTFNFTDDATADDPQSDWRVEYYTSADYVEQLIHKDKKLILIPQSGEINATFVVKYTIECGGVSKLYAIPRTEDGIEVKAEATIEALEEGCHHYFEFTFSKNGLFIKAEKYAEWEDITVKHDFE